jgi:hypothetical protein
MHHRNYWAPGPGNICGIVRDGAGVRIGDGGLCGGRLGDGEENPVSSPHP